MKTDKATKAPHILLMTKRFNEVSVITYQFICDLEKIQLQQVLEHTSV
jgi:hypothetical protein